MSSTNPNLTSWERTQNAADNGKRAEYIAGLEALANILKTHPEIPLPYDGRVVGLGFLFTGHRAALDAAARVIGCSWTDAAKTGSRCVHLEGRLHGLKLLLTGYPDKVNGPVPSEDREPAGLVA